MRSLVEVLMVSVCFSGEIIIQGTEDLKERVEDGRIDLTSTKVDKSFFFFPPLRSNFYPLSGGLILQACDKIFWQSIPAVTVI